MSHFNVIGSKENAAISAIALNSNNQDNEELKEIEVCQGAETLISIKLKNFMKPVLSGSLIFARGTISEGMDRTKLVVDMHRENNRWVVLDPKQLERQTDWNGVNGLTVEALSDMKTNLTQSDVDGLNYRMFKKHARCYKIIQYELTKENKKDLESFTPNYIHGDGYEKMFQIFKVFFHFKICFTNMF